MNSGDARRCCFQFAKTIGRVADFAVDLAEQLHKDLGLEYKPTVHGKKTKKSVCSGLPSLLERCSGQSDISLRLDSLVSAARVMDG